MSALLGGVGRVPWGALCVIGASVLWGTTGTAATFAPGLSPLAVGAMAMGLGGILQALSSVRPIIDHSVSLRSNWPLVTAGATAVAAYPLAFYTSMHLAGVAIGTVVSIGSAPLASAIIELVAEGRKFTRQWMLGALMGGVGAALLLWSGQATGSGAEPWTVPLGIALGLLAGATYALYSWAAHRLISDGASSRAAMGSIFGLGGLLLMPVLFLTGAPFLGSWQNLSVGAYMALVPMFAGYVLFGWGLTHVRASIATGLSLVEVVVAAVLAVVVVGERLPLVGWLGAALVVGSLFVLVPRNRAESRSG